MGETWKNHLKADPLPWLLESEDTPVRVGVLTDLLGRSPDDPDVRTAQAAIPTYPPVAGLLAAQKRAGYWVKQDYYLPKYDGTFWVLCVLGDLGLTAEHEPIRQGCEYLFTFQRDHGPFCRRRRVAGKGIVWDRDPGPCTHARIVRFLIQFGYADDPRLRTAVDWLLSAQRDDGMWDCGAPHRPGCLRATHDVLRVAALDAETASHPAVVRAAVAVCHLLMEPRMSRYHVGLEWTALEYPYFDYSLLSTLDALGRLGHTPQEPKIAAALDYLLDQQRPDGAWTLNQRRRRLPFDVGQPGEPNKWLTLDALRVIKRFYA
jgi:hypothetical protein